MPKTRVTLSYGERSYTFAQDASENLKGRLSCDCRRSLLIREHCDADFPVLGCGHHIIIVSMAEISPEKKGPEKVGETQGREQAS